MKVFFDTSVIIAAFVGVHPKHENSLYWLQRVKKKEIEGIISVHSLIESYSILTTLPLSPKIYPSLAANLIKENVLKDFVMVKYNTDDYIRLLDELSSNNITGGASYDGLILYAARKMKTDRILTLNVNDFIRILPQLAKIISEP
ncbi:MAG: VapC toxin family PIN domain ribonuclease [Candidatus Hydromicrobium americanum]|nr:MAG: VapC toxin family PIN domain ribonuclease [Candidatus Hydromicrobium americanum]